MMSLMDLPEQVSSMMEEEEPDDAQSLSADPDWTQSGLIVHTDLYEDSFLLIIETAEPQFSSLQAAAASFRVQCESSLRISE